MPRAVGVLCEQAEVAPGQLAMGGIAVAVELAAQAPGPRGTGGKMQEAVTGEQDHRIGVLLQAVRYPGPQSVPGCEYPDRLAAGCALGNDTTAHRLAYVAGWHSA